MNKEKVKQLLCKMVDDGRISIINGTVRCKVDRIESTDYIDWNKDQRWKSLVASYCTDPKASMCIRFKPKA